MFARLSIIEIRNEKNNTSTLRPEENIHHNLAIVLRDIGSEACLVKAEQLLKHGHKSRALNFRSLGLNAADIAPLALVLTQRGQEAGIDSVSFSYNPLLKDDGAITLIKSLPASLRELGFVQCGMGDKAGWELLQWMKTNTQLTMMCAEQNAFSNSLTSAFHAYRVANPGTLVVV